MSYSEERCGPSAGRATAQRLTTLGVSQKPAYGGNPSRDDAVQKADPSRPAMPLLSFLVLAAHTASAQPPAVSPASPASPPPATSQTSADSSRRARRRAPRSAPVTPELDRTAFADAGARTLLGRARVAHTAQDSALRAYDAKTYQRISVGMGLRRLGRDRMLFRGEQTANVSWDRGRGVTTRTTGARAVSPVITKEEGSVDADLNGAAPIPYFPGRETLWIPSGRGLARAEVDDREFVHPLAVGAEAYYRYATGDSITVKLPDGRAIALREMRITARRPDWHLFVGSFWFDTESGQLVRAAYRMSVDMDVWDVASEESQRGLAEALERARLDTNAARRGKAEAAARREARDDEAPGWVKGLLSPMRATISAVTVEYGLHQGRFWMPRQNVAEGEAQAGFLRIPIKFEESFRYDRVVGDDFTLGVPGRPTPAVAGGVPNAANGSPNAANGAPDGPPERAFDPAAVAARLAAARTLRDSALALDPPDDSSMTVAVNVNFGGSTRNGRTRTPAERAAVVDSAIRRHIARADTLTRRADSLSNVGEATRARDARASARGNLRRAALLVRREVQCATDSTYDAGTRRLYDGDLRVRVQATCTPRQLASSPELPDSPYGDGDEWFTTTDRDALVRALDLSLQPGWGPQPIQWRRGLALARYNRVEGLSSGVEATSVLGLGYTATAAARIGVADWVPNGELSISRTDGRRTIRLGAFHRLGVANDDWGSPLSFGASVAALLYSRDEGFFYRTFGAELAGTRDAPFFGATVDWRLFGERQRTAGVEPETQFSLRNAVGTARFIDNIAAQQVTLGGGALGLTRTFGQDPRALRLFSRARLEGAAAKGATLADGNVTGYGRALLDATLSRNVGPLGVALTGAGGGIAGDAPTQRMFYIGGQQTVRGQFAQPTNAAGGVASGYVGDAFWLGRAEVGTTSVGARPVVFFDMGWAGPRADFAHPGRPLTGYGVGLSFLDGLVRTDLSRGIHPQKRTRFDLYVEARF